MRPCIQRQLCCTRNGPCIAADPNAAIRSLVVDIRGAVVGGKRIREIACTILFTYHRLEPGQVTGIYPGLDGHAH